MPEPMPPTILIVDDIEASRYAVGRILRKANYSVLEADTGGEALRLAAGNPDLVILDVNLPDIGGYEVCRRIKADPATASIPVLHLSASFVQSEDRSEGLEGGADGYLTYPLEPRELLAQVEALLRVRRAEQAVRAQRELLRVTLGSIGDGVMATDARGAVTFINPVAQALTGWGEEAVGRPLDEVFRIVSEQTGAPAGSPVEQVLRTGKLAGLANHTVLISKDGTRRPIDDSAAPILDGEGRFVGVVLVFRDVTDRRRMEAELRRRADDLAERDRRKDEFLAILGHELRNPLGPIRHAAHLLALKPDDPGVVARARQVIERQSAQMARLVDDLLDASRIVTGKARLLTQRLDLTELARGTAGDHRAELEAAGLSLSVELPGGPVWVRGDGARLAQVIGNLLHNATKFTNPGGRVTVRLAQEQAEAAVTVEDTGVGISEEALPGLFDPFSQAEASIERSKGGLGLGLSVVRGIVELHGGRVRATSQGAGRGAAFTFWVPLDRGAASPAAAPLDADPGHPVAGRSVVLVEDNEDSAESLRMLLTLKGFEVVAVAHNGAEGVEAARRHAPDAVVCDLGLPEMSGFDVARALRADPATARCLLVCLTGYGQEHDRARALEAGFDEVLVKATSDGEALARALHGAGRGA